MSGKFGTYRIANDCHVTVPYNEPEPDADGNPIDGAVADVDLAAGDFTPTTAAEAAACAHLCAISWQGPDEEVSHVMAELVDGPDPEPQADEPAGPGADTPPASLAGGGEPPAGTGTTAPTGGLAEAEAEAAKAQADLKAAAGGGPFYTFEGQGTPDPAQWPAAPVKTTDDPAKPLYTFAGDKPGQPPAGASADWVVYTGDVQPA